MTERVETVDGIRLCLETFGRHADPAVLLLPGMAQTMDAWDAELCERIAASGRHVVRYDYRDAGRSEPGPSYGPDDLVDDAARVLDAVEVADAHVVGLSFGAGIAVQLATAHPARVRSLTLIGSSPLRDDLPPPDPALAATFTDPLPEPDWTDADAVVEYLVESERPFGGPRFDEARARRVARVTVARTPDVAAMIRNHEAAAGAGDPTRLADISVPTLVLHGTHDPLFPPPHGEAMAAAIPGAAFLALDGVGHEVPPPRTWNDVVPVLVRHTSGPTATGHVG